MPGDLQELKEHIDEKFKHHEELEVLRALRIDEVLTSHKESLVKVSDTTNRVHKRVDGVSMKHEVLEARLDTIKTMGLTVGAAITGAIGWLGLSK